MNCIKFYYSICNIYFFKKNSFLFFKIDINENRLKYSLSFI